MDTRTTRETPPDRRRSWTQKVKIGGHTCYLTVGEYEDKRPCEVFIDVSKCGTFVRGVLNDVARTISTSLQYGAPINAMVHMLRESDYPPNGDVVGSVSVLTCTSVTDWVASELEARYYQPQPTQEKVFGHITQGSGA